MHENQTNKQPPLARHLSLISFYEEKRDRGDGAMSGDQAMKIDGKDRKQDHKTAV